MICDRKAEICRSLQIYDKLLRNWIGLIYNVHIYTRKLMNYEGVGARTENESELRYQGNLMIQSFQIRIP